MTPRFRYSVACRGSLNKESAKCFLGGGWVTDTPDAPCPHCGKPMFCMATMSLVSAWPGPPPNPSYEEKSDE